MSRLLLTHYLTVLTTNAKLPEEEFIGGRRQNDA